MRGFGVVAIALALAACAETARDSLAAAREALAGARYAEAVSAADAGLAGGADEVTAWGLELVKLEALARNGRGDETVAQLARIAEQRPQNVPADQYAATADQLRGADQRAVAIQVLDLGLKRFPEDTALLAQIEAAKEAPAPGSDELKMLESLGYVE